MKIPDTKNPGVYLFKNKSGRVLYIGKAINLSKRLGSYFGTQATSKQKKLVFEAKSIQTIEVDSEIEALILEANLIKKYQPSYNISLKDDKDYLYLKIVNESFPRVLLARKKGLEDAKEFFGPYPSASSLRSVLKSLRRIFPFRTCKVNQGKACFYYHLGLCPGVCLGKVSETEYSENIKKLRLFFGGKKGKVLSLLEKEMKEKALASEFEKAAQIRDRIEAVNYVTRPTRRIDEYIEAESLLELRKKELTDLAKALKISEPPIRIEGYDISNFQGQEAVGSMVVFVSGSAEKSEYRRFKIKDFTSANDPGMMGEVVRRRLKNNWPLPQLIVVDGGKTQLAAAKTELQRAGLSIPVFGLAKKNEEIYSITGEIIRLAKDSRALFLLQRLRDEAHRFAISYHRKLASQSLTGV